MRIDKWLWAARFFKTRMLAARACEFGRVQVNRGDVKPSREIRIGDELRIRNDSGEFVVQVLRLDALRGPAPQARAMYLESEASIAARAAAAAERRSLPRFDAGAGKPSKRDRRELERFLSIED